MSAAKKFLRLRVRRARDAVAPGQAAGAARAAAAHLLSLDALERAEVVALYAPVKGELDTEPLARALLERGVTLAYPRVVPSARRLQFHRVGDPAAMAPGSFYIPEPDHAGPVIPVERIGLFVIPGLAFDRRGARLGWGKGYYDATLSQHRVAAPLVGYAYECQLVEVVPQGAWDVSMHHVVTEARVVSCRPRAPGG